MSAKPVDFHAYVEIDREGAERISPELVAALDTIFANVPGEVDTVALASLLCKLTNRAERLEHATFTDK